MQVHAGEHQTREHSGDQNAREQAGQNHEQKIVAGVERRQRDHRDAAEIHQAFARQFVIDLIREPAQRRAPREFRHDGQAHPSGKRERRESGAGSNRLVAGLRRGAGVQREAESQSERADGYEKIAPRCAFSGAI